MTPDLNHLRQDLGLPGNHTAKAKNDRASGLGCAALIVLIVIILIITANIFV